MAGICVPTLELRKVIEDVLADRGGVETGGRHNFEAALSRQLRAPLRFRAERAHRRRLRG